MNTLQKRCAVCGRERPLGDFCSKGRNRPKSEVCKECHTRRARERRLGLPPRMRYSDPLFRTCALCAILKPISEFPAARHSRHLLTCYECVFPAAPWPDQRECSRCHVVKPISAFSNSGRNPKAWCKECGRLNKQAWSHANGLRALAYSRQRRITHPHEFRASRDKRYALTRGAGMAKLVRRAEIIARDQGVCYICGDKPTGFNLTLDHIVPVSKGGTHTPDNLRVACRSCNSRKGVRMPSATE